jgi:hypothetical protein
VFCTAPSPATNNVLLGKYGRNRTNVWSYPGANQQGSSASKTLGDHPTPKPVELVADALQDVTQRGQLILDPFMGSGTTLIAAEAIERIACGIELDPAYVDVTIARWQQMTGKQAIHAISGKAFDELGEERLRKPATADIDQAPRDGTQKKPLVRQRRSSTLIRVPFRAKGPTRLLNHRCDSEPRRYRDREAHHYVACHHSGATPHGIRGWPFDLAMSQ